MSASDPSNPSPDDSVEASDLKDLLRLGLGESSDSLKQLLPDLAGYEILEVAGSGAMGTVYLARQISLDRHVAIKMIKLRDGRSEHLRDRLEREALLMAKLKHPHLVAVYDFEQIDTQSAALIMEWIEGGTVQDLIRDASKSSIPVTEVIRIGTEVAAALDAAHREGLIHRDIKPSNLLVDRDGQIKVGDFGLAFSDLQDGERLTETDSTVGTLGYMAPEQLTPNRELDGRTDLYSLGVVLFELLTGKLPIGRGTGTDLGHLAPSAPRALISLIEDLLEHDPNARPETAATVMERLGEIRSSSAGRRGKQSRRAVVGLIGLVGIGGLGWLFRQHFVPPSESTIDLFSGPVDSISGNWKRIEQGYRSGSELALLGLGQSVDVRNNGTLTIEFTRLSGRDSVALFFRHDQQYGGVELSAWRRELGGLQVASGMTLEDNPRAFRLGLTNNQRHRLEIVFHEGQVETRVDGISQQVETLQDRPLTVSAPWGWTTHPTADHTLILGTYQNSTLFHKVTWTPE
ncbi:MAG: serine/threonine-protein kinase [Verrucomicrobiota bacterium]